MRSIVLLLFFILSLSGTANARETVGGSSSRAGGNLSADSLKLAKKISSKVRNAAYMKRGCSRATVPSSKTSVNWGGLPVMKCKYRVHGITTEVYMLLPDADQVAKWVVDACGFRSTSNKSCYNKLVNKYIYASGGQFAIAGEVVEKMYKNKPARAYPFRDGVTNTSGARFGRPTSLTRDQLIKYCRTGACSYTKSQIKTQKQFSKAISELYKKGWGKSTNHIMRATAMNL